MATLDEIKNASVRWLVGFGGMGIATGDDPVIADVHGGFVGDVEGELRGNGYTAHPNMLLVPLAVGKSVQSMVQAYKKDPRFVRQCRALVNSSGELHRGLAQVPVFSTMALEDMGSEWKDLMQAAIVRIRRLTTDTTMRIELVVPGSLSGGTASGASREASDQFGKAILDQLSVTNLVTWRLVFGSSTFVGIEGNIETNNARGTLAELAYLLEEGTDRRWTRRGLFVEAEMCGYDKHARCASTRKITQVLRAPAVVELLERDGSNREAVSPPWGRLKTAQLGFWDMPIMQGDPTKSAAMQLLPEVDALIKEPIPGLEVPPVLDVTAPVRLLNPGRNADLLAYVVNRKNRRPADILDWPKIEYQILSDSEVVTVKVQDSVAVPMNGVFPAELVKTIEEFRTRRIRALAVMGVVEAALKEAKLESERRSKVQKRAWQEVVGAIEIFYPRDILAAIAAAFSSRVSKVKRLRKALDTYARAEKALVEAKARECALTDAKEYVGRKFTELEDQVKDVREWLFEMTQNGSVNLSYYTYRDLPEVFADLVLARASKSHGRFLAVTTEGVTGVTALGLKEMFGTEDTSPFAIAQAIMVGPKANTAPWAGKADDRADPRIITYLPPISQALRASIFDALKELGWTNETAVGSTIAGGVVGARVLVYQVRNLEDIVTPQIHHWLDVGTETGRGVLAEVPGYQNLEWLQQRVAQIESEIRQAASDNGGQ